MRRKFFDQYTVGLLKGRLKSSIIGHIGYWIVLAMLMTSIWVDAYYVYSKDGEASAVGAFYSILLIAGVGLWNMYYYKKKLRGSLIEECVDTMLTFLPISNEHKSRAFTANKIVCSVPIFIIGGVGLLYGKIYGDLLYVRGFSIATIIVILTLITIWHINSFTERFWKIKKQHDTVVINGLELKTTKKSKLDSITNNMLVFIVLLFAGEIIFSLEFIDNGLTWMVTSFPLFELLGGQIIGFIILTLSAVVYFYFNYIYVVKGIKEKGWSL